MIKLEDFDNLSKHEEGKLLHLLECNKDELISLFENAQEVVSSQNSLYETLLKILQQGNNVREAALVGILCGKILGFEEAKDKIELDIKEKLFNAFKNNRPF
ncbi:MAG: hypothetical protein CMP73_01575 [Flavobacteriales bacterium]|nr:hypothetical protein [Flavobacteriales bacterium]|tara:strand:+ start:631 stop:936 length:306 start_codon:yes stop_codon:yes gene_type:complete